MVGEFLVTSLQEFLKIERIEHKFLFLGSDEVSKCHIFIVMLRVAYVGLILLEGPWCEEKTMIGMCLRGFPREHRSCSLDRK